MACCVGQKIKKVHPDTNAQKNRETIYVHIVLVLLLLISERCFFVNLEMQLLPNNKCIGMSSTNSVLDSIYMLSILSCNNASGNIESNLNLLSNGKERNVKQNENQSDNEE